MRAIIFAMEAEDLCTTRNTEVIEYWSENGVAYDSERDKGLGSTVNRRVRTSLSRGIVVERTLKRSESLWPLGRRFCKCGRVGDRETQELEVNCDRRSPYHHRNSDDYTYCHLKWANGQPDPSSRVHERTTSRIRTRIE